MKTKSKYILFSLLTLLFAFSACSDDDNDKELTLETTSIEIREGEAFNIPIATGNGNYKVLSSDEQVAAASVSGESIIVVAKKHGTANIIITDNANRRVSVSVRVRGLYSIELSTDSISTYIGITAKLAILDGNGDYKVEPNDKTIVSATILGDSIVISPLKSGLTSLLITDKNKKTATLKVNVENPIELAVASNNVTLNGLGSSSRITVTQGNGYLYGDTDYFAFSENTSVAIAAFSSKQITVTATGIGATKVHLIDKANKKVTISVVVTPFELDLIKKNLFIKGLGIAEKIPFASKNGNIKIVSNSNASVATITYANDQLEITSAQLGTTNIAIKDEAGQTAIIHVTVENVPTVAEIIADDRERVEWEGIKSYRDDTNSGTYTMYWSTISDYASLGWFPIVNNTNYKIRLNFTPNYEVGEKTVYSFSDLTGGNKRDVSKIEVLKKEGQKIWVLAKIKNKPAIFVVTLN